MTNKSKAHGTVATIFAAAIAYGMSLLPLPASAEPGEFVDGVLQPLADGFPSRPITFVNTDEAGSRDGIYARSLQEALRGISPVEILVSDEPGATFGTFYTIRDVASRDGGVDGYYPIIVTVPGMMSDLVTEPITADIGLTGDDANMVIATEDLPYAVIQRKDAPWGKTFKEMVAYAKEHPGELRYISNQVGSGTDLAMEWIMKEVGIKVKKIPAQNQNALASAVGAGEGDFSLTLTPTALQHFQAGRIDVTLITGGGVPAPWDKDPNVVSAKAYGLPDAPWATVMSFAVVKDTPKSHVDWLYKLIKAGAETDLHQQRVQTVPGTVMNIRGPEETNAMKATITKYLEPVVRELGLAADQK